MRKLKKALAVLLSAAMVLGMSSMAFADPENDPATGNEPAATEAAQDPEYDKPLTVSGLEEGDVVHFYKVIEWVGEAEGNVTGWKAVAPFDTVLTKEELTNVLVGKAAEIDPDTGAIITPAVAPTYITAELAGKLARAVTKQTTSTDVTVAEDATTAVLENTSSGLYMAIVTPKNADVVYNPIFVAADYFKEKSGDTEAVSTATYSDAAAAKKSKGNNDKKATTSEADYQDKEWTTVAIGETVHFNIDSTIPGYGEVYEHPVFKLSDKMDGLDLQAKTLKVYLKNGDEIGDEIPEEEDKEYKNFILTTGTNNFTISFTEDYLRNIKVPTNIVVSYDTIVSKDVKVNIDQLKNELSTQYSRNPSDESDYGFKKDTTQHYIFTIGAEGLGLTEENKGKKTSEIVKVGVDGLGNPMNETTVKSEITETNTYKAPLKGAKFKLYTNAGCTEEYRPKDKEGKVLDPLVLETDDNGRMTISGLDAGTYYIKETEAPAGFVKNTTAHKIQIIAELDNIPVTEYTKDGITWTTEDKSEDPKYRSYTYESEVLKSYTVLIDDDEGKANEAAVYNFTNNGSDAVIDWEEMPPVELPSQIKNVQGAELPATGGIGTTIFYILGSILVIGAGVILVARRRMGSIQE